jgi:SulP family sulfate permease
MSQSQADDLLADSPEGPTNRTGPAGAWETVCRIVPAFDSLRTYKAADFRADLVAGLTVAAVAVPQAMAYALVVGTGPEYGLYTAIVMTAVGALFDSSKQLINGPTNAIAIALFSALAPIPVAQKVQAAILLALLVGLIQTGITLLRLGDLTRYVSHAVIVGFTLGASVILVFDQAKHIFGPSNHGGSHDGFYVWLWNACTGQIRFNSWTTVLGLGTILTVVGLRQFSLWLRVRIPEFLIVLVAGATVVWALGLESQGVPVIGTIPPRLPSFSVPDFDWQMIRTLSGSALAIAVLGLLEAIAMAKAIAAQTGQKLDMNQQCLSEGLANLTGGFFQCFPGSGSLTRSAINQQAGAVTQWSGVISAVAVASIVLVFAPYAHYIPRSALAGILMVSAWRLVDRKQLVYYLKATRFDAVIVLLTALAAVVISVEFCILIGVFLSFVLYMPRAARLHLTELIVTPERVIRERAEGDPTCGRLLIFDLEGELFFGAAPDLDRHLELIEERAVAGIRVVVLRLRRVRNADAVCLAQLDTFVHRMEARKVPVLLCGVRADLARALRTSGLGPRLGPEQIFEENGSAGSSTLEAVRHAYDRLGADICSTCPRRDELAGNKEPLYYMI